MARNRKHIYKHFIYHINNINTRRLEKNFHQIFFTTKKFGFYCLYEFVFIYQMDRWYHLIMSKYSNLLWLIYWHFLPTAAYVLLVVYFLRRINSTFTQLYKLFFPTPNSIFSTCRRHRTTLHTPLSGGWEDSFIKCRVYFVFLNFLHIDGSTILNTTVNILFIIF